jgi:hypothetical protein
MAQIDLTQIGAIELQKPGVFAAGALQKSREGGFAGAAASDHPEHRAGRNSEAYPIDRRRSGADIGEADVLEGDLALEFRSQAARGGIGFHRPVDHRADLADRSANLFVTFDQLGQADQRLRHALAEHDEGEQSAHHVAFGSGHRQIDADQNHTDPHEPLDWRDQSLRPVGHLLERETSVARGSHLLVPKILALRLQRQGLYSLDAVDRFGEGNRLFGLRQDHRLVCDTHRADEDEYDQGQQAGAGKDQPRQRRVQKEQERQKHQQRDQVEKRGHQLACEELGNLAQLV